MLGGFPRQEDSIIDIINYTLPDKDWLYIVLENKVTEALKKSHYSKLRVNGKRQKRTIETNNFGLRGNLKMFPYLRCYFG